MLDFDGTILDTEQPVYQSWAELWQNHDVELSRSRWQAVIGTNGVFDPWMELQQVLGRRLNPALLEQRRQRRDALQAGYVPRDGILEWLAEARRLKVAVAVASSSPVEWVAGHLERLGLGEHFGAVVCRDDLVPAKPDPTSYREACRRLGARPAWSVAVEDSAHGVAAARAAGLYTIAVPHGLTADLDLSAADLVVSSLSSLSLGDALRRARQRDPHGGEAGDRPWGGEV
ncbi:MAG TPA: HAD-IA family hydrolase [Acidimicrobiales bacterium]|nr:HAD-IA family hydrolase [Acidimicrobiales bacterium]